MTKRKSKADTKEVAEAAEAKPAAQAAPTSADRSPSNSPPPKPSNPSPLPAPTCRRQLSLNMEKEELLAACQQLEEENEQLQQRAVAAEKTISNLQEEVATLRQEAQRAREEVQLDCLLSQAARQATATNSDTSIILSGIPLPPTTSSASPTTPSPDPVASVQEALQHMGFNPVLSGPTRGENDVRVVGARTITPSRGPPLVRAQLGSVRERAKVLSQRKHLPEGARVKPDLTYAQRQYRAKLLPVANQAFEAGKVSGTRPRIFWEEGYRLVIDGEEQFPPDSLQLLRTALQPPPPRSGTPSRPGPPRTSGPRRA